MSLRDFDPQIIHDFAASEGVLRVMVLESESKNEERKTTSIRVNPEIWKKVKKHCIDIDKDVSEYLEELIKEDFAKKIILIVCMQCYSQKHHHDC